MTTISATVKGFSGLQTLFKKAEQAANPERALDEVGAILLNRIRTRFLEQVDTDGVPWVPSKAAQRRASGSGGGTLFDTGALFNSIQLFNRGPGTRAIATDVSYAPKHQFGLDGNPRREFLGFSDEDVNTANEFILSRINKVLNG